MIKRIDLCQWLLVGVVIMHESTISIEQKKKTLGSCLCCSNGTFPLPYESKGDPYLLQCPSNWRVKFYSRHGGNSCSEREHKNVKYYFWQLLLYNVCDNWGRG